MKSLTYYQVECPKCHSPLNSTVPLSGEAHCPFCGEACRITANMTKEGEAPGQIVPFATTAADFGQSAMKMLLAEDFAPVDISGIVSMERAKSVYLPVFLYEGEYECVWSCLAKNGVAKGVYAMVCLACEDTTAGKEIAEYVRSLDVGEIDIQHFQKDTLYGHFFLPPNCDSQSTWKQWGEETLNHLVAEKTRMQWQGKEMKDFNCTIDVGALPEYRLICFPVWMIRFPYDGELHHIFMDGTGRNGVKGTTLTDRNLKALAEKPFTALKYISVAAIIVPFLILLAGWYLQAIIALIASGLIFFGYRFYARWHKSRIIRKARKQREKELGKTHRNL